MIKRLALQRLREVRRKGPPDGYWREQLMGKLKRLAESQPIPAAEARRVLCDRLADLVNIREKLTRRPVTESQVKELKGFLND